MALNEYSSILSIIYFSINIIFLIALGLIVYNQGGHELDSKAYFKDIWNQRKIYAPLIIHFYDTATDIGVVYSWYHLMGNDYDSVDMVVFFWTGVSFLVIYRLCLLCWSYYDWACAEEGEWYYVLLVLVDLYIFVAVYESFMEAEDIITSNAKKRQEIREQKRKARQIREKKRKAREIKEKERELARAIKEKERELARAIKEKERE
eukprot:788432_1